MMIEVRPDVWVNKDGVTFIEFYGPDKYPADTPEANKATGRVHFHTTSVLTTLPHEALLNAFREPIDFMSDEDAQAQWEDRYRRMVMKMNERTLIEEERRWNEAQRMMQAMKGESLPDAEAVLKEDMRQEYNKAMDEAMQPALTGEGQPLPKMVLVDDGPHSRACGFYPHPHGQMCSADCPTCQGKLGGLETSQIAVQDVSVDSHNHGHDDPCEVDCPVNVAEWKRHHEDPRLVIPASAKLQPGDFIKILDGGWELVEPMGPDMNEMLHQQAMDDARRFGHGYVQYERTEDRQMIQRVLKPHDVMLAGTAEGQAIIDFNNERVMHLIAGCLALAGVTKNDNNYWREIRSAMQKAVDMSIRGEYFPDDVQPDATPESEQVGHGHGHGHQQPEPKAGGASNLAEAYDESIALLYAKVADGQNVTIEEMYSSNPYRDDDPIHTGDPDNEKGDINIPPREVPMYGTREEDLGVEDWRP